MQRVPLWRHPQKALRETNILGVAHGCPWLPLIEKPQQLDNSTHPSCKPSQPTHWADGKKTKDFRWKSSTVLSKMTYLSIMKIMVKHHYHHQSFFTRAKYIQTILTEINVTHLRFVLPCFTSNKCLDSNVYPSFKIMIKRHSQFCCQLCNHFHQ